MNLEQMRARLGEIVALLAKFDDVELTDENLNEVNALNEEFEGLTEKIKAKEKMEEIKAKAAQPNRQTAAAPVAKIEVGKNRVELDPKRGFATQGEFYVAVVQQGKSGRPNEKIQAAGLMEKASEDGGVLVPEDFRLEIQTKIEGDESLLPLTTQFRTDKNSVRLPVFEQAPWDSSQGIQAYWVEEGGSITESKPKMGEFSARLHKLAAKVRVTEELLEDAPLLESWVRAQAPTAIVHRINSAIIAGSGAGTPQGILNSGFKIKVAKESGQAADTVLFANLNKMLGAIIPSSLGGRARWMINPAILPLLRTMEFSPGSSTPIPVYLPGTGIAGAPYGTLFGLPIMPMMGGVKAVGDEGDIMLVDLSYYYSIVKSTGVKASMSTHVHFDTDEVALKFTQRVGGGTPYKAPITNEAGDFNCAGLVTLADRA